jgi:putative ABC transport system permease protein
MGLLLGKFLSRSGVLGVHRALGASKASVFYQRLLECELVGVIGGVAGVALAALALRLLSTVMPSFIMPADLFQVDGFSLVVALGLALLAGLASGLYPAWRACRIAPAIQLKLQ